jgi:Tfp pilus assembly protein PilO
MKRDNLIIQKYEIALSSSYENIYNFIRVLNNSGKVIKIKDLTLKNGEQYSSDINLKMDIDYYLNL